MSNTFFEKSKEIANDFIQSIVFLDDKAYKGANKDNPAHDFDILKISKAFAREKKICATYRPESNSDIDNFKVIANKADIVVLDWQIEFSQSVEPGTEEEDASADEPRGIYTKEIIKSILFEESFIKNSLKLIIVYTGDIQYLKTISEEIYAEVFDSSEDYIFDSVNHIIHSSQFRILVRAKSAEVAFQGNKEKLEKYMVNYEDLPALVLSEFTHMTSGLLSNFALISLTTLRKNSSKILGLFSNEMDNAFLLHKLLLPNPNDANEQLIQNFSQSIEAMLNYINDNNSILSTDLIDIWLEETSINKTKKICKQDIVINTDFLKKWVKLGYNKAFFDLWEEKTYDIKQLNDLDKSLSKVAQEEGVKFLKDDNNPDEDSNFSILTLHKSNVKHTSSLPKLALGSIIKHIVTDEKTEYFLCIQAKCDSIRFENDRRFIFIELDVVQGNAKFNLLARNTDNDVLKFKYRNKSYDLKTFKFNPSEEKDTVFAKREENYHYFETVHNEKLIWLCDLKDMQAQRISNIIAAQISRVGLDESEWLRRFAN